MDRERILVPMPEKGMAAAYSPVASYNHGGFTTAFPPCKISKISHVANKVLLLKIHLVLSLFGCKTILPPRGLDFVLSSRRNPAISAHVVCHTPSYLDQTNSGYHLPHPARGNVFHNILIFFLCLLRQRGAYI